MNAKKLLRDLEDKDMDRRDFLKYAGLFLLGIVGTSSALGWVLPETTQYVPEKTAPHKATRGFGSSKYGV